MPHQTSRMDVIVVDSDSDDDSNPPPLVPPSQPAPSPLQQQTSAAGQQRPTSTPAASTSSSSSSRSMADAATLADVAGLGFQPPSRRASEAAAAAAAVRGRQLQPRPRLAEEREEAEDERKEGEPEPRPARGEKEEKRQRSSSGSHGPKAQRVVSSPAASVTSSRPSAPLASPLRASFTPFASSSPPPPSAASFPSLSASSSSSQEAAREPLYDDSAVTVIWQSLRDAKQPSAVVARTQDWSALQLSVYGAFDVAPTVRLFYSDSQLRAVDERSWPSDVRRVSSLLVFLEPERQPQRRLAKEIEHIPHPAMMTHASELRAAEANGHPAIAYALAEFIDNAMTALRSSREAEPLLDDAIDIVFMEHTAMWANDRHMSVLISDNGCGMNEKTLRAFATMADSPERRGIVRGEWEQDERNNFINLSVSQYGIGAKSAAFYLGSSLSVSTRTAEPGSRVWEICIDAGRMNRQFDENGNAFRTTISSRLPGQAADALWTGKGAQLQRGIASETTAELRHFSRFYIDHVNERLFDAIRDGPSVSIPLADLYYRQLHGPYGHSADTQQLNASTAFHAPRISLSYHLRETVKWAVPDLREVTSNPQFRYFEMHRGPVWRCAVDFPIPSSDGAVVADGRRSARARARIEVLYFPRRLDGETHPDIVRPGEQTDEKEPAAEAAAGRGKKRAAAGGSPRSVADSDDADGALSEQAASRLSSRLCSGFWHGRLIPLSHSGLLYFMQNVIGDYRDSLHRLKVSIFFAYPVLTDRVKLQFKRSMADMINEDRGPDSKYEYLCDASGSSVPATRQATLKTAFLKQLKAWALLDANYQFMPADYLQPLSLREEHAHFSRVFLGQEGGETVKQGDVVKVQSKWQPAAVFLRVLCIRREQRTVEYEREASRPPVWSRGQVIGYQEPRELELPNESLHPIFRDAQSLPSLLKPLRLSALDARLAERKLKSYSLRLLVKDLPRPALEAEYRKHCSKVRQSYPRRIRVFSVPRHELQDDAELQLRVHQTFDASAVVVEAEVDGEFRPVSGEKVRQTFYVVKGEMPGSHGRSKAAQTGPASGRRRKTEPQRRVIPKKRAERKEQQEQAEEEDDGIESERERRREEAKKAEAEVRYSSSGRRLISRLDHLSHTVAVPAAASPRSGGSKKGRSGSELGRAKRRKTSSGQRGAGDDAMELDNGSDTEDDEVKEEKKADTGRSRSSAASASSALPSNWVMAAMYETEVAKADDAAAICDPQSRADITSRSIKGFKERRYDEPGRYVVRYQLTHRQVEGDRDHVRPLSIRLEVFPGEPAAVYLHTPSEELRVKLGQQAASGLFLVLQDADKNPITPRVMEGWRGEAMHCAFTLSCPELPQLRVTANPQLVPRMDSDVWELAGVKIEPVMGDEQAEQLSFDNWARGRSITCRASFLLSSASRDNAQQPSPPAPFDLDFRVRLRPGDAQQLDVSSFPAELQLPNMSSFPPFSLQLLDGFGQPTGVSADPVQQPELFPLVSVWCDEEKLPAWNPGRIPPIRMSINGHLQSSALSLPPLSLAPRDMTQHLVSLTATQYDCIVHLRCESDGASWERSCVVHLMPRLYPSYIILHQPGDAPSLSSTVPPLLPPCAAVPLCLSVTEESGYYWKLEDEQAEGSIADGWRSTFLPAGLRKGVRVVVLGLEDEEGNSPFDCPLNLLHSDGRIPGLRLPRRPGRKLITCEVRVEFDSSKVQPPQPDSLTEEKQAEWEERESYLAARLPFVSQFDIRVQFGAAERWSAEISTGRIRCGLQWRERIRLWAVDRWGNQVAVPESVGVPRVRVQAAVLDDAAATPPAEEKEEKAADGDDGDDVFADVQLRNAEPEQAQVHVAADASMRDGEEDDDIALAEHDHFTYPKAFLLMKVGLAVLTVYDAAERLQPSDAIPFYVDTGYAKRVRAHLQHPVTGSWLRLRDGLTLPARFKAERLLVSWMDRALNPAEPDEATRRQLVLQVEQAAIFTLPEGTRELTATARRRSHLSALPQLQDGRSVFPPFVCIYTLTPPAEEEKQRESDERLLNAEAAANELAGAQIRIRLGLWDGNAERETKQIASMSIGCCMLPFSVKALRVTTLFTSRSPAEIARHRLLLSDELLSDLSSADGHMELAGALPPTVSVQLETEPNSSSFDYALPPPDPTCLSLEWTFDGSARRLAYLPPVYDADTACYHFRPQQQREAEAKEDNAAVSLQAGEWTYSVVYTETRPTLADVLSDRKKEQKHEERILPGFPQSLRVLLEARRADDQLPIVTNSADGARVIARDVKLVITDAFGDVVWFSLLSDALLAALAAVSWKVEPVDDASDQLTGRVRSPPELLVSPHHMQPSHHALISCISVVDSEISAAADSGLYAVRFQLPEPAPLSSFSASLRFFFSNELRSLEEQQQEESNRSALRARAMADAQEAAARLQTLRSSMQEAQEQEAQCNAALLRTEEEERRVVDALQDIEATTSITLHTAELRDALRSYGEQLRTADAARAESHPFASLDSVLAEASETLSSRYLCVEPVLHKEPQVPDLSRVEGSGRCLTLADDGFYGQLASFISVEDDRLCRLISWFFSGPLSTFLVTSRSCPAVAVLERNATRCSQRISLQFEDGLPPAQPLRPLPHLSLPAVLQASITGNPRYVRSLLEFRSSDSRQVALYSQAVSAFVRNVMVVNRMEDAHRYRQLLAQHRMTAPTLLAVADMKSLSAVNTELFGPASSAPTLQQLIPRLGVETAAVRRAAVRVAELRQRLRSLLQEADGRGRERQRGLWTQRMRELQAEIEREEKRREHSEARLRELAAAAGGGEEQQPLRSLPASSSLQQLRTRNSHRRRRAR